MILRYRNGLFTVPHITFNFFHPKYLVDTRHYVRPSRQRKKQIAESIKVNQNSWPHVLMSLQGDQMPFCAATYGAAYVQLAG